MLTHPNIDPVFLALGPIKLRWYGLMYLIGFLCAWGLAHYRNNRTTKWSKETLNDLIFYGFLGAVLGGRVGYILFYQTSDFLMEPLMLFRVWEGGMSFHGGLLGGILAVWLMSRKMNEPFLKVTDFIAPLIPLGLAAGRLGNFINGELWGRATNVSWGMVFQGAGNFARHPSQLYECLLEGIVLFILLWWYSAKPRPMMAVSGLFLLGYGVARFSVEFFREPDRHLGFIALDWMTMGHLLTLPMIIIGMVLMVFAYRRDSNATIS